MSKNDITISVVVPVYHVARYIDRCVYSILNQTYQKLEIILVDDGSNDICSVKCDKYASMDSRIKVIHKENGGLSSARNAGIDMATGDYIGFVDSDDYISPVMYECLAKAAVNTQADMCAVGTMNVYSNHKVPAYEKIETGFCSGKIAYKKAMIGSQLSIAVWTKIFKKNLFSKVKFRVGKYSEDCFFLYESMPYINSVWYSTEPLYFYVHREGSITTEKFNKKHLDVIEAYDNNYESVKKRYPDLIREAKFRQYWSRFFVLDRIMDTDNYKSIPEYFTVVRYLRKNWMDIFKMEYFTMERRIASILLKVNPSLYRVVLKLKETKDSSDD